MSLDYLTDIKPFEDRSQLGAGGAPSGTDGAIDVSADSPTLDNGMEGLTLWTERSDGVREYGVVTGVNNGTKTITVDTIPTAGTNQAWGLIDDASLIEDLDGVTVSNIANSDFAAYCDESEWWIQSPDGFEGGLHNAWLDVTMLTPARNRKNLKTLFGAAFGGNDGFILTTIQYRPNGRPKSLQFCMQLLKTLGVSVNKGHVTQSEVDDFYALGGGLRFPTGLLQTDLDTCRSDYATQQTEGARRALALQAVQVTVRGKTDTASAAALLAYQTADYSQDIDHAAAVVAAADTAYSGA